MPKLNARAKGATGEREFCKWLDSHFDFAKPSERNLEQVRSGGTDIIQPPFGFEVKRRQGYAPIDWWIQVKSDCSNYENKLIPVVAFRANQMPWEFLISAELIGNKLGFLRINEKVFLEWAIRYMENENG